MLPYVLSVRCPSFIRMINLCLNLAAGFLRWYSRLYRNQGSLLFGPGRFDWGEQIVLVTGGKYMIQPLSTPAKLLYRRFRNWGTACKYIGCAECYSRSSGREPNRH